MAPPSASKHSLRVMTSSESVEHYTPAWVIELAYATLGAIDIDPCSSTEANKTVGAKWYYTEEDGRSLTSPWYWTSYGDGSGFQPSRLWMNPPYGRGIKPFIQKLQDEYTVGHIREALALVKAAPDTAWWRILAGHAVCFLNGRLHFNDGPDPAPFPSAVIYLGGDNRKFYDVWHKHGTCYVPQSWWDTND